jgi:hypothetical protein
MKSRQVSTLRCGVNNNNNKLLSLSKPAFDSSRVSYAKGLKLFLESCIILGLIAFFKKMLCH